MAKKLSPKQKKIATNGLYWILYKSEIGYMFEFTFKSIDIVYNISSFSIHCHVVYATIR